MGRNMAKKQKDCAYHLCSNKEPLQKCPYCGYYFCGKHIKAENIGLMKADEGRKDPVFMQEWREENGHPCPEYIRHLIDENRKEAEKALKAKELKLAEIKKDKVAAFQYFALNALGSAGINLTKPVKWMYSSISSFAYHLFFALLAMLKLAVIALAIILIIWQVNSMFRLWDLPSTDDLFPQQNKTVITGNCSADWQSGACDPKNRPLYCNNGTIENRSSVCGCGGDLRPSGNACIPKVMCSDGTFSPDCSVNRPYQCVNGTLVERASKCGCLSDAYFKMVGEVCINVSATESYSIEQRIHELINAERQKNGMSKLEFDEDLTAVARVHSQDMLENGYLEHVNLEGEGPADRAKDAGYYCYKSNGTGRFLGEIGENIGLAYIYGDIYYVNGIESRRDWYSADSVAEAVVQGWMNSHDHRANILDGNFTKEGIGVAISIDGKILLTQDFC